MAEALSNNRYMCENRPPCTHNENRDSTMNDVIEVWSRSGENLEVTTCILLEIQKHGESANLDACVLQKTGVYCSC